MGFSKKLSSLAAAAAVEIAYYNFCWRLPQPGKSGQRTPTPAMMAGLVAGKNHAARLAKLIERLRRTEIGLKPMLSVTISGRRFLIGTIENRLASRRKRRQTSGTNPPSLPGCPPLCLVARLNLCHNLLRGAGLGRILQKKPGCEK